MWRKDIMLVKNVLDIDSAKQLIDISEKKLHFELAAVGRGENIRHTDIRTNYQLQFSAEAMRTNDPILIALDQKLYAIFNKALNAYKAHFKYDNNLNDSGYHLLRYQNGQKYDEHFDGHHRIISGIIYLNSDFKGGELWFPIQKITVKPEPGMLVMFPSNFVYLHTMLPVNKGTKYDIMTWFSESPTQQTNGK